MPDKLLCVFSSKMRTNFDFIGIPVEETPHWVRLKKALVFTYEESAGSIGVLNYVGLRPGYMTLGTLGPDIDDVVITLPMENIAYTVELPMDSEHPVVQEYKDYFTEQAKALQELQKEN